MQLRSLVFAALGSAFMLGSLTPAFAQDHRDHRQYAQNDRDHGDRGRHDVDHRHWDRGYQPPPVVVAPPAYGYYAPPPVAYAPGISVGINIP